jgi:hypothetical protein
LWWARNLQSRRRNRHPNIGRLCLRNIIHRPHGKKTGNFKGHKARSHKFCCKQFGSFGADHFRDYGDGGLGRHSIFAHEHLQRLCDSLSQKLYRFPKREKKVKVRIRGLDVTSRPQASDPLAGLAEFQRRFEQYLLLVVLFPYSGIKGFPKQLELCRQAGKSASRCGEKPQDFDKQPLGQIFSGLPSGVAQGNCRAISVCGEHVDQRSRYPIGCQHLHAYSFPFLPQEKLLCKLS